MLYFFGRLVYKGLSQEKQAFLTGYGRTSQYAGKKRQKTPQARLDSVERLLMSDETPATTFNEEQKVALRGVVDALEHTPPYKDEISCPREGFTYYDCEDVFRLLLEALDARGRYVFVRISDIADKIDIPPVMGINLGALKERIDYGKPAEALASVEITREDYNKLFLCKDCLREERGNKRLFTSKKLAELLGEQWQSKLEWFMDDSRAADGRIAVYLNRIENQLKNTNEWQVNSFIPR